MTDGSTLACCAAAMSCELNVALDTSISCLMASVLTPAEVSALMSSTVIGVTPAGGGACPRAVTGRLLLLLNGGVIMLNGLPRLRGLLPQALPLLLVNHGADQCARNGTNRRPKKRALAGMSSAAGRPGKGAQGTANQSARAGVVLRAVRVHTAGRQHEFHNTSPTHGSTDHFHSFSLSHLTCLLLKLNWRPVTF